MELPEKDEEKGEEHIRKLIKKSQKMQINSSREEVEIISQWKTFHNKKISKSRFKRKETIALCIFILTRIGDKKIMQAIRLKRRHSTRKSERN